jgi:hypothetical protein
MQNANFKMQSRGIGNFDFCILQFSFCNGPKAVGQKKQFCLHSLHGSVAWFYDATMTLRTAHKILISTAVLFFFGIAFWEFRNYLATGELWAAIRSLIYASVAVGFGVYLGSLKRWLK